MPGSYSDEPYDVLFEAMTTTGLMSVTTLFSTPFAVNLPKYSGL